MIKKFQIELLILGVLFFNIFFSYNIDIGFYIFFVNLNNSLQYIYLKEFFEQITVLGDSAWYYIFSLFLIIFFYFIKKFNYFKKFNSRIEIYKNFSLFLFFALIVTGLLTQLLKHIMGRPRPNYTSFEDGLGFNFFSLNSEFHSFPSGHTSIIFTVALVIAFFAPRLKYFLIFFAGIIALSRISVGAHFFTDVAAGIAVSCLGIKLTKFFLKRYFLINLTKEKILNLNNKIFFSLAIFLFLIIFLTVGSSIDIHLSSLFYYNKGQFLLQSYDSLTVFFRKILLPMVIVYIFILPAISLFFPLKIIFMNHKFKFKDIIFLWGSGILNLLIVVNLLLKNNWGRSRPGDIIQLGGEENFTPWYQISNSCNTNCSFVSGDAAVGFSIISLYFLTKNEIFFWLSLFIGTSLGLIRIMEGGHFLSDVVMSAVILFLSYYFQTKYYLKKYA